MAERCENALGSEAGLCVPIDTPCLTHAAGEEFSDGEVMRTCQNMILSDAKSCRENRRLRGSCSPLARF